MTLLRLVCLVLSCVFLAIAQEVSVTCRELVSVAELYRTLRSRAIETAAQSQESEPALEYGQYHRVIITALNHTCHHDQQAAVCSCPARHELNFDPNRIPKVLAQTRCCGDKQESFPHWITKCTEVYENVPVLRKAGCSEGVSRYRLQWERVPVGCSCQVMPSVFSAQ
ncbi:unnamed protein product [Candidula unifasciata]|uniref:Uncharacterized protein n=1 Tax=Candidula unifasciata TaxID=100452 RepID=A0A8S4A5H7_9EUPU|nr:unnamed protein product [Candidula unifasciata]